MQDLAISDQAVDHLEGVGAWAIPFWNLIKTRFLIFPKKIFIGLRSGAI